MNRRRNYLALFADLIFVVGVFGSISLMLWNI